MDIFDPRYGVKMRELIIPDHNKNIFIAGNIVYVLNDE